ncbi:hypothetical protein BC829DRAFT_394086 [Chytridium lagenaria]|nr:hypothetical protein BC829DRAFT_394086 [Chytridium lagenaria]
MIWLWINYLLERRYHKLSSIIAHLALFYFTSKYTCHQFTLHLSALKKPNWDRPNNMDNRRNKYDSYYSTADGGGGDIADNRMQYDDRRSYYTDAAPRDQYGHHDNRYTYNDSQNPRYTYAEDDHSRYTYNDRQPYMNNDRTREPYPQSHYNDDPYHQQPTVDPCYNQPNAYQDPYRQTPPPSFPATYTNDAPLDEKRAQLPLICLVTVVAVLAVVATFGYFFWPRFPQVTVLEVRSNDLSVSAFEFSIPKDAQGNFNKLTIKMNLKMNISCYNDNLYDLKVDAINLAANIEVNSTALRSSMDTRKLGLEQFIGPPPVGRDPNYKPALSRPIGTGSRNTIVFPSRQNRTFEMNFAISYTPDPQLGLVEDPTFAELMNVCGVTGRERPARISYSAQTAVSFLRSFGYKPEIASSILIRCPIDKDTLNSIFDEARKPNATVSEIIQKVFGTNIEINT